MQIKKIDYNNNNNINEIIMKKQDAGRKILANIAPKFAELNDDVLFGQVWAREDKLSLRDRSLITISALLVQVNLNN